ncbi:TonB-dependent receptor [Novosphingobium resinovorum]|uniref:TonB-dependent receptor n=1 Tax=Novosphingobium resinovorum TaxID=158500 RepID=A0A1D8AEE3_9SPHN|nr:TonB-dependent receptor [Novosphingobium resinovorum]AOR80493.1 hypothetical protein BES08_26925 [Novosphingobium resinovorum]
MLTKAKMLLCHASLIVLAWPLASQAADAEDQQQAAPATDNDIIVTARRVEERLQDVPIAISAVSGAALEQQGVRQITDLSATVPNLSIVGANADAQTLLVTIRGQNAANSILTTDNSVGMYIDGVNVPRTYGLRAGLVDIARVEVLRGPQGTLYGRNTTGGAISFITKDPDDKLGASIQATGGNYNLWGLTGILNVPITDGVGARFVAVRSQHDGYGKSANTGDDLMSDDSTYLRAKIKADTGGPLTAAATVDYQKNNAGGLISKLTGITDAATSPAIREVAAEVYGTTSPTADQLAAARNILQSYVKRAPFHDSYSYGSSIFAKNAGGVDWSPASTSKTWSASLDLKFDLSDDLAIRSISGYRNVEKFTTTDFDGTPFIINSAQLETKDDFYSQELQVLGGDSQFNYVGGLFYSYEDGTEVQQSNSTYYISRSRTVFDGDVTSKSYAAFGQANWKFAPGFSLTLGGRYTKEVRELVNRNRVVNAAGTITYVPPALNDDGTPGRKYEESYKKFTWLASLDYKISDDVMVYAKSARGFRGGGQQQRATSLAAATSFDPEVITEYELGLKSELLDRRLTLNLAGFYDNYTDVQRVLFIVTPYGAATALTNASKARILGFEGEATFKVTPEFTLRASIGTFDAKYKGYVDDNGVDHSDEDWPAPTTNYQLGANYVLPTGVGDLTLDANWSWQSAFNTYPSAVKTDQVTQKAYGLLNGRIALALDDWNADISIFGRNILGKKYYNAGVSLEGLGFNTLAAGDPRTVGVQVRFRFGGM